MRQRGLGPWLLAALCLIGVEALVRGPFLRGFVVPGYVDRGLLPRERTNGHLWRATFEGVARLPSPDLRIGIVGDSTVNATVDLADKTSPAGLLRAELRRRLPRHAIDVIDVSQIGLYANDVALIVNKILHYDVIIYGLTLRALPAVPHARRSGRLMYELGPAELTRLCGVGACGWLFESLSAEELAGSLLQSGWATYAYRPLLKRFVWEYAVSPALAAWPALREELTPSPFGSTMTSVPRALLPGALEWSVEGYDFPNSNWEALETINGLCERHAAGRCLIYSGPINPLGRERLTEPGLFERYLQELRILTGRHGTHFRDFTNVLTPADFRKPMYPRPGDPAPRDPIHMNVRGAMKLAELLAAAVIDIAGSTLRASPPAMTPAR